MAFSSVLFRSAPGGIQDRVRQGPGELLRQLDAQGLLPLDAIRLSQGGENARPAFGGPGAARLPAVADVALLETEIGAEGADLGEDDGRRGPGRVDPHQDARARAVRGRGDAGVAGGRQREAAAPVATARVIAGQRPRAFEAPGGSRSARRFWEPGGAGYPPPPASPAPHRPRAGESSGTATSPAAPPGTTVPLDRDAGRGSAPARAGRRRRRWAGPTGHASRRRRNIPGASPWESGKWVVSSDQGATEFPEPDR